MQRRNNINGICITYCVLLIEGRWFHNILPNDFVFTIRSDPFQNFMFSWALSSYIKMIVENMNSSPSIPFHNVLTKTSKTIITELSILCNVYWFTLHFRCITDRQIIENNNLWNRWASHAWQLKFRMVFGVCKMFRCGFFIVSIVVVVAWIIAAHVDRVVCSW